MQCLSKLLCPSDPIQPRFLAGVREENYSSVADGPGDAGAVGEQTDSAPSADTRLLKSLFCTRTPSRGQAPGLW